MRPFLALTLSCMTLAAVAQPRGKMKKAIDKFYDGEMEEAIGDMRQLLEKDPSDEGWSYLVDMYYYRWRDAIDPSRRVANEVMQNFTQSVHTVQVRDKDQCRLDLLYACAEATLYTRSTTASFTLRGAVVDHPVDTARTAAAKEAFENAESAFTDKDYAKAIESYREVLRQMPDDYQSTIYLGDCHFFLEAYDSAAFYFSRGVAMQPTLLEPRKYLSDALAYAGDNEGAMREAIATFWIYPDESMYLKLHDLHKRLGRTFDRRWMPRTGPVNLMNVEQPPLEGPWKEYRAAKDELAPYCDENGIVVKPGAPEGARFLEVFSWQRMLERSKDLPKEFAFAKHLSDQGELDLYVFLSVFHHGFYEQFKAFAASDGGRFDAFLKDRLTED